MSDVHKCEVCSKEADLKCSGCKMVRYCSPAHQKNHWKIHKFSCKPYKVVSLSNVGRCLVASRGIDAGDVILSECPLVVGPKTHQNEELLSNIGPCVGCYRPVNISQGEKCPRCEWPACSSQCSGLTDPHHHGAECVVLKLGAGPELTKLGNRYYRYSALMMLRCLVMQRKFPKKWEQLLDMQSHEEDRTEGTEAFREAEDQIKYLQDNYFKILNFMENQSETKILNNISPKLQHKICGILDVNALDITLNTGIELSAIYPTAYYLEHNCLPNTRHHFDLNPTDAKHRFKITVKAARRIQNGEHITTMYTHALWGTQQRREHLKSTKYFDCFCERCKDPTEMGTYLSGLKCLGTQSQPCGGTQLPIDPLNYDTEWSCDKCEVKLDNKEVAYLVTKINDDVDNIQSKKPTVRELEDLLDKLSLFLHPNHYHLYTVKHSLIQLYGYQQGYTYNQLSHDLLQRKMTICRELLDITKKLDPYNVRLQLYSSVLLHELHSALVQLGKRKWEKDENKQDALVHFKEANILLKKCKFILENETHNIQGDRLAKVVHDSESSLTHYLKENNINAI